MGWNGGDGWNMSGDVVCHARTAKDQVLGVVTLGQQVTPHVRYGMTCLLIRDVVGCESCSEVWGKTQNVI
jgi:hypothetical protein